MDNFAAIDFETANNERTSVCSVGVVIVRDGGNLTIIIIGAARFMVFLVRILRRLPSSQKYGSR